MGGDPQQQPLVCVWGQWGGDRSVPNAHTHLLTRFASLARGASRARKTLGRKKKNHEPPRR